MTSAASDHPEGSNSNGGSIGLALDEESQFGGQMKTNAQTNIQPPKIDNECDPSSRLTQDETTRLWEDLKTETGFSSYDEFLGAHEGKYANVRALRFNLRFALRDMIGNTDPYAHPCAILDVQDGDSTCCKLTLRCYSTSGTKILSALRQPPPKSTLGIVLWDSTSLDGEMLNALGLGLRIPPHFFSPFLARHPKAPAYVQSHVYFETNISWKIADDFIVVGQYVMTVIRNYLPAKPDAVPIILIVGFDQKHLQPRGDFNSSKKTLQSEDLPTLAMNRSAVDGLTDFPDRLPGWMRECVRCLDSDIKNGRSLGGKHTDLPLSSLTALLQCTMPLLRQECRVIRESYLRATNPTRTETDETVRKSIFEMRYLLRRMIEDFEDNSLRLRDCIHSQTKQDTPQSQSLMALEGALQLSGREATRLETEIRDYLQLQIGELALQESKKSIELSNSQIEEGKRGKS